MAEQQQWFAGKPEENFGLALASDTSSRESAGTDHLRTNWIFKTLTMVRIPFVYHRQDLLETQFFKTTFEDQGSRVFGSSEQTIRPPAVEGRAPKSVNHLSHSCLGNKWTELLGRKRVFGTFLPPLW